MSVNICSYICIKYAIHLAYLLHMNDFIVIIIIILGLSSLL